MRILNWVYRNFVSNSWFNYRNLLFEMQNMFCNSNKFFFSEHLLWKSRLIKVFRIYYVFNFQTNLCNWTVLHTLQTIQRLSWTFLCFLMKILNEKVKKNWIHCMLTNSFCKVEPHFIQFIWMFAIYSRLAAIWHHFFRHSKNVIFI